MPPDDDLPAEERDWHRFRQLDQLHNHWQRPGWSAGRRSYHWFLTFEHDAGVRALAAQCQEPFRDLPQFDLVPLESLHLTLCRLAFTDELPASCLPGILRRVEQWCSTLDTLRLAIGWLSASAGAIRFTALPVPAVVNVRNAVLDLIDLPRSEENLSDYAAHSDFWPHVSIAYSNTVQSATTIAPKLEALRSLSPAEVLVSSVALVELQREGSSYRWDELGRIRFRPGGSD